MEVPQRKKNEIETSFWDACPDQWIKKAKVFCLCFTLLLERVNQRGGDAVFGFYMRCVMRAPSLSCALRTVDAASARAAMRADGEDGKEEEEEEGGLSLSLSPPSNPSYSAPLQCDHVSSHNMPHAPSSNHRVNARTGRIGALGHFTTQVPFSLFFKKVIYSMRQRMS